MNTLYGQSQWTFSELFQVYTHLGLSSKHFIFPLLLVYFIVLPVSHSIPCAYQNDIVNMKHPDVEVVLLPDQDMHNDFEVMGRPLNKIEDPSFDKWAAMKKPLKGFFAKISNNPIYFGEEESVILSDRSQALATQSCSGPVLEKCTHGRTPLPSENVNTQYSDKEVIVIGPVMWGENFFHTVLDELLDLTLLVEVIKSNPSLSIVMERKHSDKGTRHVIDIIQSLDFWYNESKGFERPRINVFIIDGQPTQFRTIYVASGGNCGIAQQLRCRNFQKLIPYHNLPAFPPNASDVWAPQKEATPRQGIIAYMSRRDGNRNFHNETAVIEVLREVFPTRTVIAVHPSIQWQTKISILIGIMQNAALIVSPHGSGLANLIFARAGTHVLEFMPSHMYSWSNFNLCFNHMASGLRMPYWMMPLPGNHISFSQDPSAEDLRELLQQIDSWSSFQRL